MIARPRAGDVEQVALGGIDLFQVGGVTGSFDARLRRDDLVIAGHDGHGAELQTFGQVHGADSHRIGAIRHLVIQQLIGDDRGGVHGARPV